MPTYTLQIQIDPASLKTLYASNEKLTLVKQTDPCQAEVAWMALAPFLTDNDPNTREYEFTQNI
ncbi:MAG: hypothetical protein OWR62_16895 [Sulfobacillus thermotolerans]|jgi:hypothetical protein|nr:hypothetical protein [Sulfobacillus thermotolerans]